jgi:hypothetical protein
MAVQVEDFTQMAIGTKLDNGTIEECPHCGKLGLMEEASGRKWFTHSQSRGYNEDGNPVLTWEMCPKTKIIGRTSPAEDEF